MNKTLSATYNVPTLKKSPVVFIDTTIIAQLADFNITMDVQHCFTTRDDGYVVIDLIDYDPTVTKGESSEVISWQELYQAMFFIDPMLMDNFIKECDVRCAQIARAEYDRMCSKSNAADYDAFVSKLRETFACNLDLSDLTSTAIDNVELSIDYGREINVDLDHNTFEREASRLVADTFDEAVSEVMDTMNPEPPAPTNTNNSVGAENNLPVTQ